MSHLLAVKHSNRAWTNDGQSLNTGSSSSDVASFVPTDFSSRRFDAVTERIISFYPWEVGQALIKCSHFYRARSSAFLNFAAVSLPTTNTYGHRV